MDKTFIFFAISGVVILVACGFIFWLKKKHGFLDYFVLGWALQLLLSLPVGIWQSVTGWGFLSFSWKGHLVLPLVGWPFNMTGLSGRMIFDSFGKELGLFGKAVFGSTSIFDVYLFLALLQGTVLALLFAWRYMKCRTFKDWLIIGLGVIFLLNSLINAGFCWNVG